MKKINDIIKSYKQRLVQVDSRSSSYFLSVLKDRSSIDLVDVWREFSNCDLQKCLFEYNEIDLKPKQIDHTTLTKILKERKSDYRDQVRSLIPSFSRMDLDRFEVYANQSDSAYKIKNLIDNLVEKYDKIYNAKFRAFSKLMTNARSIVRDFGKDDLYLGFPFIEGKFSSGNVFRAPLVLHRVKVIENGSSVKIKMEKNGSILNPVFLTAYLFENGLPHQKLEWEIEEKDYLNYALKIIKENLGVNVLSQDSILYPISSVTKKEYYEKNTLSRNSFYIKYYAVLGMFPLSNRNIFNDLEDLEKTEFDLEDSLNSFILGDIKFSLDDLYQNQISKRPSELFLKYVTPLDYSQKCVVGEALEENLVIEGPPGTGKSQTIVNIIINSLIKDKRILVVSEKVAAINVIYNRLGLLQENTLIIKNHLTEKENFYEQLDNTITNLPKAGSTIYSDYNDVVIEKHLDNIHKMNSKEAFKGFSYKEIIYLNQQKTNFSLMKKLQKYLKRHIHLDKIESRDALNLFIDNLTSKKGYADYENYLKQRKLKTYKKASIETLKSLVPAILKKQPYNVLVYNTYLANKYKGIIPFVKYEVNQMVKTKVNNLEELEAEVTKIWDRKELALNYVEETNKFVYDIIIKYPGVEEVIIKWKNLGETGQKTTVKKFFNPNFKLKGEIEFSDNEFEVYDHLKKYISAFNIEMVRMGIGVDVTLYKQIRDLKIKNKNQLAMLLLQNGFSEFKDKNFDKLQKQILSDMALLNIEHYIKGMHINKQEGKLLKQVANSNDKNKIKILAEKEFTQKAINSSLKIKEYFMAYQNHYQEVNHCIDDKIKQSFNYIYGHVKKKIKERVNIEYDYIMQLRDLKQQVGLKRRKGIKTIALRYFDLLHAIYPVMLMTPEVASAFLPLKKGLFDLVIFDEASQMFVERAIPSIYRGNNIVVAGDSQQLKPTSVFTTRFVEDEEIDEDLEIDNATFNALTVESLLDHAKGKFRSSMLLYHYRSMHKELIDFSSNAFYGGRLLFASFANSMILKPITVIDVLEGRFIKRRNEKEAFQVLDLVKFILATRKNNETVGIVTFNINQKEYIEDLMLNDLTPAIQKEMNRINIETKEDESLFVKNIENVQGDERDIIIFSIGYAYNEQNRLICQFGSLNQVYGENRLNVAITRAKKRIYIIKSIEASMLHVNENNRGPLLFKKYLEYAELLNKEEDTKVLLETISNMKKEEFKPTEFDFQEELIYDALCKKLGNQFEVHKKIRVGSFYVDYGIYHKQFKKYVLGIECDGFDSALDVVERDYYRQVYLEDRGWQIYRLWSVNWWENEGKEIKNILDLLDTIIKKGHDESDKPDEYKPNNEKAIIKDLFDDSITCICGNVFSESLEKCPKCKRSIKTIIEEKENKREKTSLL